jgi:hypothetical protein
MQPVEESETIEKEHHDVKKGEKKPSRPCKHCKGSHWDNKCPKIKNNNNKFEETEKLSMSIGKEVNMLKQPQKEFSGGFKKNVTKMKKILVTLCIKVHLLKI